MTFKKTNLAASRFTLRNQTVNVTWVWANVQNISAIKLKVIPFQEHSTHITAFFLSFLHFVFKMLLPLSILVTWCVGSFAVITPSSTDFTHSTELLENEDYHLFWKYDDTTITFEIHARTLGWVGFGLSLNGGMTGSDVTITWVKDGQTFFSVSLFFSVWDTHFGTENNTFGCHCAYGLSHSTLKEMVISLFFEDGVARQTKRVRFIVLRRFCFT